MRISADSRLLSVTAVLAAILIGVAGAGMRAAASAEGSSSGCRGKSVSENRDADRGSLRGFVDPRTGEILTHEEALDMEITGEDRRASSGEARATAEVDREIRLGRRVPLEGGGYIAEVVAPLPRAELKAKISAGGVTEILCHRHPGNSSSRKDGGRE